MADQSIYQQARELETQVGAILSAYDVSELPVNERNLVSKLKNGLVDARLDTRDYEYAQTRSEQLRAAKDGRKRFEQLRRLIVRASEYNLFGAVDVAQLSAGIEQITSHLE